LIFGEQLVGAPVTFNVRHLPMRDLPKNPWLDTPNKNPFILPSDEMAIRVFNRHASPDFEIHTNLVPEPFFGPFNAPIVVLLLNPGVDDDDARAHRSPKLRAKLLRNLRRDDSEMPHVHLGSHDRHPGALWWGRAVDQLGCRERVARSILAIQYFPYHSRRFAHSSIRLPSQEFTFALVRRAISRGAVIVQARGLDYWLGAVPELAAHSPWIRPSNVRRLLLSRGNLGKSFTVIQNAVKYADA